MQRRAYEVRLERHASGSTPEPSHLAECSDQDALSVLARAYGWSAGVGERVVGRTLVSTTRGAVEVFQHLTERQRVQRLL